MKQLLATCLAVVCGASLALAAQQALHVSDGYASIQAAIDAAEPGDAVYIAAGRYQENLIIDKPLSLIGEGRREVRIEAADPARPVVSVEVDAGTAWLEGFAASGGTAGVRIDTAATAVVWVGDVIAVENEVGILAAGEGSASIAHCFVVDNRTGVAVGEAACMELVDTEIARGVAGVVLAGGANVTLSRCLVGLARLGVSIYTTGCGWESGEDAFTGTVKGEDNRIFGTTADVCPEGPGAPWPGGFVDEVWRGAVGEIVTAYNQGMRASQAQDYQRAYEAYSMCLSLFAGETVVFPLLEAYVLNNIGLVYRNLGRYEEALAAYESARAVFVDREMEVYVANVDTEIGNAYYDLGRYDEALAAYQSARTVVVDREMEVEVAVVDQNIGVVYRDLGRYEEALAAYQAARAVYVKREMKVDVAEVDTSIGIVYRNLGRYDEALAAYQSARAVYVDREMEVDVAEVDQNIGIVYRNLGRYEEALAAYEAARAVFADREMEVDVAEVDHDIGNVYQNLGRYEEALAAYRAARAVFVDREMEVEVAVVDQNMGVVYDDLGRYEEALAAYQSARAVFVEREMEVYVAKVDQNIGVVYRNLGRYKEALVAYQAARAVYVDREMEVDVANVDTNIGNVYGDLGRYEEALVAYQAARAVYVEREMEVEVAVVDQNIGNVYRSLGRYEEALAKYEAARAVFVDREMEVDVAKVDQNVGAIYRSLGRYEEALAKYEAARAVFVDREMEVDVAKVDQNVGVVYRSLGRYEDALAKYEAARAVYVEYELEMKVAEVDKNIGNVYCDLGRYEDALAKYEAARAVYVEYELEVKVAGVDQNIGNVYCDLGRYEDALAKYEAARAVFVDREMEVDVAKVDQNVGVVYRSLGRYEDALAKYEAARAVYVEYELEMKVAEVDQNIVNVYCDLGRYEEALAKYEAARAVFVDCEMEVDVAKVDTSIGVVYWHLGRYEEALAKFEAARTAYVAHEMEIAVAEVDQNIGAVYVYLGRYEEALAKFEAARTAYVAHEMEIAVAEVDHNIGAVYVYLGRYEEALAKFEAARTAYVAHEMEIAVAEVDQNIGAVYVYLGRYEEALAVYRRTLERLDNVAAVEGMTISCPATRWVIHGNMGIAHERLEEWNQAVAAYASAIAVIESIRGGFTSEEIKMAWQERTQHVYERLIDLLYRMGEGESAFPYVERCRARTFLDTLCGGGVSPDQLISVEAGVSSDGVDVEAINEAIVAARKSLLPSEAVLEYMVTEDGIFLWVITASGIGPPAFVPYPRSQLIDDVRALRETLESTNPDEVALGTGLASFYERLVQPELALLGDEIDTLVFIPSGPLWYLPFAALAMTDLEPVPMGGIASRPPHLVEHYTIAYLPSLASLPTLMSGEPQTASTALVALANPTLSEAQIESLGMPGYQYAELEDAARRFAICYTGSDETVYAATEADEPRAYQGEAGAGVEIYACHGAFNPYAPLQSKLLLAPGAESAASEGDMRRPDGDYHAWEAMLTDHRGTELVMLAACETLLPAFRNLQGAMGVLSGQDPEDVELSTDQLEQIVVGDEVVGLARAFLSSGADSVLGTLWQANPGAIEELLVAMCAHHQAGMTWGQALQNAQEDLIVNATYGNVWFWAPYQLIGRWR